MLKKKKQKNHPKQTNLKKPTTKQPQPMLFPELQKYAFIFISQIFHNR